jgi:hypothetical protein
MGEIAPSGVRSISRDFSPETDWATSLTSVPVETAAYAWLRGLPAAENNDAFQ